MSKGSTVTTNVYLTDTERMALSWLFHGKHPDSLLDEYRAEDGKLYNLPSYERVEGFDTHTIMTMMQAYVLSERLKEGMHSLERFDYAEKFHLVTHVNSDGRKAEVEIVDLYEEGQQTRIYVLNFPDGRVEEHRVLRRDDRGWLRANGWSYAGWGYGAGWNWRLTEEGRSVLEGLHRNIPRCCEGVVRLHCVCSYRTYCAEHGGGCHGTHD